MSKISSSLIALAIASFCGLSQAEDVSFSGFAHGSRTVTATLATPSGDFVRSVSAGGFTTVLNGGPSFESYCVDLFQSIAFGAPPYPEYTLVGLGHVFTNGDAYADLGRLYATAGLVNDAVEEAAFQIAVWEIAYERTENAYDLSSGAATFAGGTAAGPGGALELASEWLSNLTTGAYPTVTALDSAIHQDIITTIPEPETYALFMAGLAAVGFMSRRRRKA